MSKLEVFSRKLNIFSNPAVSTELHGNFCCHQKENKKYTDFLGCRRCTPPPKKKCTSIPQKVWRCPSYIFAPARTFSHLQMPSPLSCPGETHTSMPTIFLNESSVVEIWSYIPRPVLDHLKRPGLSNEHKRHQMIWGMSRLG